MSPENNSTPTLTPAQQRKLAAKAHKHRHNVLTLSFLVLVVASLFGAYAWQSQRVEEAEITYEPILAEPTDPTADWQTFYNYEYGFEFKYPPGWETCSFTDDYLACVTDDPDAEYGQRFRVSAPWDPEEEGYVSYDEVRSMIEARHPDAAIPPRIPYFLETEGEFSGVNTHLLFLDEVVTLRTSSSYSLGDSIVSTFRFTD